MPVRQEEIIQIETSNDSSENNQQSSPSPSNNTIIAHIEESLKEEHEVNKGNNRPIVSYVYLNLSINLR